MTDNQQTFRFPSFFEPLLPPFFEMDDFNRKKGQRLHQKKKLLRKSWITFTLPLWMNTIQVEMKSNYWEINGTVANMWCSFTRERSYHILFLLLLQISCPSNWLKLFGMRNRNSFSNRWIPQMKFVFVSFHFHSLFYIS